MPAFLLPLLGNKYLWWLAALIAIVLVYFGWRAHERGIGAAKVVDQIKTETEAARARGDKAATQYRRDGTSKRLRGGDY